MSDTWNQAICWSCWLDREPPRAVPVRLRHDPHRNPPAAEMCAWCGVPTHDGVYVRADPATVKYPHDPGMFDDHDATLAGILVALAGYGLTLPEIAHYLVATARIVHFCGRCTDAAEVDATR